MKLRALSIPIVIAIVASFTTPAHAQSIDPCSVYTCMAGISGVGASGGPACLPSTNQFFDELVVYDEMGFDPFATAAVREMYMYSCPGTQFPTNAAILNTIIEWYFDVP